MLNVKPVPWYRYQKATEHWKKAVEEGLNLADPKVCEHLIIALKEFGVYDNALTVPKIGEMLLTSNPPYLLDINDLLVKEEDQQEPDEGEVPPDFSRFDVAAWFAAANPGAQEYSMKQIMSCLKVKNWSETTAEDRLDAEKKKREKKALALAKKNWSINAQNMAEMIRQGQIEALKVYDNL